MSVRKVVNQICSLKLKQFHQLPWKIRVPWSLFSKFEVCHLNEIVILAVLNSNTAQKMNFAITNVYSKCEKIHRYLQIWLYLLKKSVTKTSHFVQRKMQEFVLIDAAVHQCFTISIHRKI